MNLALKFFAIDSQVRDQFSLYFPDAPFLEPRPDANEENVEHNDPGINGFTPDPEPAHQHNRSQTTTMTQETEAKPESENIL